MPLDVMFRGRRDATEDEGEGGDSSVQYRTITLISNYIILPQKKTKSGKRNAEEKKRKKRKKK